jgi:hypothetical protein
MILQNLPTPKVSEIFVAQDGTEGKNCLSMKKYHSLDKIPGCCEINLALRQVMSGLRTLRHNAHSSSKTGDSGERVRSEVEIVKPYRKIEHGSAVRRQKSEVNNSMKLVSETMQSGKCP